MLTISLDIERLMTEDDRTVQIMLQDGKGGFTPITAEVPKRPQFISATPKDVSSADIAKQLTKEGFSFKGLDLAELGMSKDELNKLAKALVDELGSDLQAAADVAAQAATGPKP